jgi:hypothetical protein
MLNGLRTNSPACPHRTWADLAAQLTTDAMPRFAKIRRMLLRFRTWPVLKRMQVRPPAGREAS